MSNSVLVEESPGLLVIEEGDVTVLETAPINSLVVEDGPVDVLVDQSAAGEVVVESESVTVLEILHVLPTETIPEEEEVYAKRVDFVTDLLIYRGEAAVGTLESEALWRVRRLTLGTDDDVTEEWANGNANFVNTWDNRASLSYS